MSTTPTNPVPEAAPMVFRQDAAEQPADCVATPVQLTPRQRIQQAAFYGHDVRHDPDRKAAYAAGTDEILRSPYAVAVADYLNAPNITNVDFSGYHGKIGDAIIVHATDDFAVHHVRVCIQNPDGSIVEEGDATPELSGTAFRYVATAMNDSLAGDKITVTAADHPGNQTSKQETL